MFDTKDAGTASIDSKKCDGLSASQKRILQTDKEWKSLIIIIPVRLGLNDINPNYSAGLKECLKFPQSLGFVGGRPRSSYYFLGYQVAYCRIRILSPLSQNQQADRLLYLDPHTIQKLCSPMKLQQFSRSFHCKRIQTLSINDIDPSLALGFYCRDRDEFLDLWSNIQKLELNQFPPFRTAMSTPIYADFDLDLVNEIEEEDVETGGSEKRKGAVEDAASPQTDRSKQPVDDGFVLI